MNDMDDGTNRMIQIRLCHCLFILVGGKFMKRKRSPYSKWLLLPALLIYTTFFVLPNIAGMFLGFTDWNVYFFDDIQFNGIENFIRLFQEQTFWIAVKNTFYFAFVTVIIKNILGFIMALLVQETSRFNSYLRTVMFMPIMISSIVVSIIFVAIYNPSTGVLNQFLRMVGLDFLAKEWLVDARYAMNAIVLMEIWQWSGFNMIVFLSGMKSIPADYYESAKIDGATRWQEIRYIMIPLMVQSFTITFIFSLISGLKVFAQVYGTTNGGPADATQVMATFLYRSFSHGHYGYSAAVGFVFMILISVLSLIAFGALRKKEVEY